MSNLTRWLANTALSLKLRAVSAVQGARLSRLSRNPMRTQLQLLKRILASNQQTTFGRQHHFASITGYEDFEANVPVNSFEQLRAFVEAEIERGETALTSEPPVCYVRTSGTTDKPKDLPLTARHLSALRRIHETATAFQYRCFPQAFSGSVLAIVSPSEEGVLTNGRAYGSASGFMVRNAPGLVRQKFVLPSEVLTIQNSELKYLLILRLALSRADLSYAGTANPTTMLALIRLYREHAAMLTRDVRIGGFFRSADLPADVAAAVAGRLAPDAARAAELERLPVRGARIADLWPQLRLMFTWTFGSSSVAIDALRRELPAHTRIVDIGYMASEFRGTIAIGRYSGTGFPTLDTHFFEFVERDRWDRGEPAFLTLDRLRKGCDYYVVVTTPSGLYRYFINDLVRVVGRLHRTPLLRFVQKGKGVTSITGEKLYESQVLSAVRVVLEEQGVSSRFLMMLADEADHRYILYLEIEGEQRPDASAVAIAVDRKLAELNVEYHAKRESRRLENLQTVWLRRGAGEAYKEHCVRQGQREGQFKTIALAYRASFGFDMNPLVERQS
jgi:hypothetical protein